jgi:hypothetical protein
MQENSFFKNYLADINYIIVNTIPTNFYNPGDISILGKKNTVENKFTQNKINPLNENTFSIITFEKFVNIPIFKSNYKLYKIIKK